jgi:uncharacterized membrane protein
MPMNGIDRIAASALLVLATVCLAGIVHIVSIFALPRLVEKDAFARLSALSTPAKMQLLPRPALESGLVPFSDPAMVRGICLFDLTTRPLRISGTSDSDRLLALSFRTRDGHVFFSMTDQAAVRGNLNILVLSQSQLDEIEAAARPDDEPSRELRLVAPSSQGIILVDALPAVPGEWARAEDRVMNIRCDAESIAEE